MATSSYEGMWETIGLWLEVKHLVDALSLVENAESWEIERNKVSKKGSLTLFLNIKFLYYLFETDHVGNI